MNRKSLFLLLTLMLVSGLAQAQESKAPTSTTATDAVKRNTSYIDEQGTAHVSRIVALPVTVSEEARKYLAQQLADQPPVETIPERRQRVEALVKRQADEWNKICPVTITEDTIAGVPVRIVTPKDMPAANRGKVLINLHGGGFNADAGSLTETIPIASYSKMKVIAVLYRLVPEHRYPAAVEDAIAVYKELLKTYSPRRIAIYGTSAGAVVAGEVAVRINHLKLPKPGALGIFSGHGDFARKADSLSIFGIGGLSGRLDPPKEVPHATAYPHGADLRDPLVSPIYADLRGMPPTLFVSSTRDVLLSGTVNLHRAFLKAGADAQLTVYEGLPHAFWYEATLPESIEANQAMAAFFARQLSR